MMDNQPTVSIIAVARDLFCKPHRAMQALAVTQPWRAALVFIVLVSLLDTLATFTGGIPAVPNDPNMPSGFHIMFDLLLIPLVIVLGVVLIAPAVFLIATGITYLLARLLRGHGSFRALLATQAFAGVPYLLLAPATILLNLLAGPPISGLLGVIALGWTTTLCALGLQASMGLSHRRAWAIEALPYAMLAALACILLGIVVNVKPEQAHPPVAPAAIPAATATAPPPTPTSFPPDRAAARAAFFPPMPTPPTSVGHPIARLGATSGDVTSIAWSSDGHTLATGSSRGLVQTWDATGKLLSTLATSTITPGQVAVGVAALAWSPDGRTLAVGDRRGELRLWENGALVKVLPHPGMLRGIAWSPNSTRIAVSFVDRGIAIGTPEAIRIWLPNGEIVATLYGYTDEITGIAWSPDGARLAASSRDSTVLLWTADGSRRAVVPDGDTPVLAVAWSPDGAMLASGGDGSIRLWDAAGRSRGTSIDTGINKIIALAWSPDGAMLIGAGAELTLDAWYADGRTYGTLPDQPGPITGLGLSPDGTILAVGYAGPDTGVWLWQLDQRTDGTP